MIVLVAKEISFGTNPPDTLREENCVSNIIFFKELGYAFILPLLFFTFAWVCTCRNRHRGYSMDSNSHCAGIIHDIAGTCFILCRAGTTQKCRICINASFCTCLFMFCIMGGCWLFYCVFRWLVLVWLTQ